MRYLAVLAVLLALSPSARAQVDPDLAPVVGCIARDATGAYHVGVGGVSVTTGARVPVNLVAASVEGRPPGRCDGGTPRTHLAPLAVCQTGPCVQGPAAAPEPCTLCAYVGRSPVGWSPAFVCADLTPTVPPCDPYGGPPPPPSPPTTLAPPRGAASGMPCQRHRDCASGRCERRKHEGKVCR